MRGLGLSNEKIYYENVPHVVEQIRTVEQIYIPFITLAELRAGFLCGSIMQKNENILTCS